MLSNHGAQILRAVGASIRKFLGGSHHQMVNLPMTSVMELRGHRMAIAACFAFQREISSSVLRDFFDSIGQSRRFRTATEESGCLPITDIRCQRLIISVAAWAYQRRCRLCCRPVPRCAATL